MPMGRDGPGSRKFYADAVSQETADASSPICGPGMYPAIRGPLSVIPERSAPAGLGGKCR